MTEADPDIQAGIETDGGLAYFVFTCPGCGKNRYKAADLHAGSVVECSCGDVAVTLSGDNISQLQAVLDTGASIGSLHGMTVRQVGK